MRIRIKFPNQDKETEYRIGKVTLRFALDYLIRHDIRVWEIVRDVAGVYQGELLAKEMKRRNKALLN